MATNNWQVGVPYTLDLNGQPFFTQPEGAGTAVFPTQQNGPWADYPVPGLVINEYSPWWAPPCGHAIKNYKLIPEYDYTTNKQVMLVCCNICTLVVQAMNFDDAYDAQNFPIIIG